MRSRPESVVSPAMVVKDSVHRPQLPCGRWTRKRSKPCSPDMNPPGTRACSMMPSTATLANRLCPRRILVKSLSFRIGRTTVASGPKCRKPAPPTGHAQGSGQSGRNCPAQIDTRLSNPARRRSTYLVRAMKFVYIGCLPVIPRPKQGLRRHVR